MKYGYKIKPNEWVVMYNPERDEIALAPKQFKRELFKVWGWYYVGKL